MQNDDLAPWEYVALAEFRYQIRRFVNFSANAARDAGLNLQQHQLLLALKGIPPGQDSTIGYLAERLHIRHHSAVELVNRLCRAGLARRRRDPADKRRVRITITPRGARLLRKLTLAHYSELQSMGPALIKTLQRLIKKAQHENQASGRSG
jgi:DNA-binding MarR family transcriptional regulator